MTQVKYPLGNTDRYMRRCRQQRENGDGMLGAFLLMLGIGFLLALATAL